MRLLLLALALATSGVGLAYNAKAPLLPDPVLSPGAVLTSNPKVICVPGYTKTVRNVPQSLKNQVYRAYGITTREPGEFEIDHVVSLELRVVGLNLAKVEILANSTAPPDWDGKGRAETVVYARIWGH